MPCCPDEPLDSGFGSLGSFVATCAPEPAELLPARSQELPAPIAISSGAPPPYQTHAPPRTPPLAAPPPDFGPPIYLVTLRLRN
jgi:hypothetical protein